MSNISACIPRRDATGPVAQPANLSVSEEIIEKREITYVCSFNKDRLVILLSLIHQGSRVNSVLSQVGPIRFESLKLIIHIVD